MSTFEETIRKGLAAQGYDPPTGYRRPAQRHAGYGRVDRALTELHARRSVDEDGVECVDLTPGKERIAALAAADVAGEDNVTARYHALARAPLGKIATSVTPPTGTTRPPHRPTPISQRSDWRPTLPVSPSKLRRRTFELREALRPLGRITSRGEAASWSRIAACGATISADGGVSVVAAASGRASYRGVATCGSVWECPVCSAKIQAQRGEEIRQVADRWHGLERCVMFTMTIRHGAGQDLGVLRRGLAQSWRGFCRGAAWRRIQRELGIEGTVTVREVTHGPHGWHPHLHVLVLLHERPPTREFLRATEKGPRLWVPDMLGRLIDRWQAQVWRYLSRPYLARRPGAAETLAERASVTPEDARACLEGEQWDPTVSRTYKRRELEERIRLAAAELGIDPHTPDDEHALVSKECLRADYLAKLGLELTASATKTGRKAGHRTPLQIAGVWADQGDAQAAALWREWCASMVGARQLTWSRGLKRRAGVVERTDDELAEHEDPDAVTTMVGTIAREDWQRLRRRRVDGVVAPVWILERVEADGSAALPDAVLRALSERAAAAS